MGVCYSMYDIILFDMMSFITKGYTLSKPDYKVIKKLYSNALKKTIKMKNEKTPFENFNSICRKEIDIHPIHIVMVTTKNNFHETQEGKELLSRIKRNLNMYYIDKK